MWDIPKKIVRGVRNHGLNYFVIVARNELAYPRFSITPVLRNAAIAIGDRMRPRGSRARAAPTDCLQFIYDLGASSVAFDFGHCLAAAELTRRQRGLAGLQVIFIPGRQEGLRLEAPEYERLMPAAARHWRVRHILLAMLALLPSVRGYMLCCSREEAAAILSDDPAFLYPDDFRMYLPRQPARRVVHDLAAQGVPMFPMLRATDRARELIGEFLARVASDRRPIVITLRHYAYNAGRNSRLQNWVDFANGLDRNVYAPIFVLDSETIMRREEFGIEGYIVCESASWDLEMRMALYEAAWLNMAIMHGPMELCWFNERVRYLIFFEIGTSSVSSMESLIDAGHPTDGDLTFAKPYQHIVWKRDELPTLRQEFAAMLPRLALAAENV